MKEAIQNGTFERDIPMCLARGNMSIMLDPNLSENEKNVQVEKFSQEYMAKLQKWVQNFEKRIFDNRNQILSKFDNRTLQTVLMINY